MHLNHPEAIHSPAPPNLTQSVEKLSSMKLIPGAKKIGDCLFKVFHAMASHSSTLA